MDGSAQKESDNAGQTTVPNEKEPVRSGDELPVVWASAESTDNENDRDDDDDGVESVADSSDDTATRADAEPKRPSFNLRVLDALAREIMDLQTEFVVAFGRTRKHNLRKAVEEKMIYT